MRLSKMFGLAAVAFTASVATANAQQPQGVQAGMLECRGGQNVSYVVGSNAQLTCVFTSPGRRPEGYVATIRRFGLDLGFTETTTLQYTAYAPSARIAPGSLAGSYNGVGTNASVGLGFGGSFLVGGNANAYSLAPIGVQGQTGLNVASGIVQLELQPAAPMRRMHRRHHRHH